MFIIHAHLIDGTELIFRDTDHDTIESIMGTFKQAIRSGMFLQVENKLINLSRITFVEIEKVAAKNIEEV